MLRARRGMHSYYTEHNENTQQRKNGIQFCGISVSFFFFSLSGSGIVWLWVRVCVCVWSRRQYFSLLEIKAKPHTAQFVIRDIETKEERKKRSLVTTK